MDIPLGSILIEKIIEKILELLLKIATKSRLLRLTKSGKLYYWIEKLGSEKEDEKLEAIEKLSKIKSETCITPLIKALNDVNGNKREAAAQCLGRIGKPSVLRLIEAYEDSSYQIDEEWIGKAFEGMKNNNEAIESILSLLNSDDWRRRDGAAFALGEIRFLDDIRPLITKAREDGHWEVKEQSITALGKIRDCQAIPSLIDILGNDDQWRVRAIAATVLREIGDSSFFVIDGLIKALGDTTPDVCKAAAEALGELGRGNQKAVNALIGKLTHDHSMVREAATFALCRICDPKGVDEIGNIALNHTDLETRKICIEALKEKENNLDKVKRILEAVILKEPLTEVGKLASQELRELDERLQKRGSYGVITSHP